MSKHVAFSKEDDEVGEPSVDIYLYDYCDSQSVVSEAPSIDLGLIQEQQQQQRNLRANMAKVSRGHERGMGKLLKQANANANTNNKNINRRSSLSSEISQDLSTAENSFWGNEDNSFADYAQFGNKGPGPRRSSLRMSMSSDADNSFWNNEENSFADYMQFGGGQQNQSNGSRVSGPMRSGSMRMSELRFDHDDASLDDSVLSMGSFALDGNVEIFGFEDLQEGLPSAAAAAAASGHHDYKASSKAAMMTDSSSGESWSITESILKGGETNNNNNNEQYYEEDLRDAMPQNNNNNNAGMMRRAERRAQRAKDRVSAYSRTPSRSGSIGSISLASSGGPRRNGSLGKYSDHSRGSLASSSGVGVKNIKNNNPRRSGSLGKYSDHSGRNLSARRSAAGGNPRRTGSIGAPIRSQSAHGMAVNHNNNGGSAANSSTHAGRRSTGTGHRRLGSVGKAHSARALGSAITATITEVESPPPPSADKKVIDDGPDVGSPTLRQRNGKGASKVDDEVLVVGSPTLRQRGNGGKGGAAAAEVTKKIVSPRVSNAMKQKLLGSSGTIPGTDLPLESGGVGTIKRKSSKLKMGKDSDHLPRSATLRQQLLG